VPAKKEMILEAAAAVEDLSRHPGMGEAALPFLF